jgi:hypothetical protein
VVFYKPKNLVKEKCIVGKVERGAESTLFTHDAPLTDTWLKEAVSLPVKKCK